MSATLGELALTAQVAVPSDLVNFVEKDQSGLIPASVLPSYVDDVLVYAGAANFPGVPGGDNASLQGETGKIYVDSTTNLTYRFADAATGYIEISPSPGVATTTSAGLMSATDKSKLDGIASGANNYVHPTYTARTGKPTANQTPAFGGTFAISQITTDTTGHVTGATDRTVKIPNTTATTSAAGLMSATDKNKLEVAVTDIAELWQHSVNRHGVDKAPEDPGDGYIVGPIILSGALVGGDEHGCIVAAADNDTQIAYGTLYQGYIGWKTRNKTNGGMGDGSLILPSIPSTGFAVLGKIRDGSYAPPMDGDADGGSSEYCAREDHVHPTDTSRAAATHAHGNITSGGQLQTTDVAIANGDKLVITDASNSNKVARATLTFDGSTTNQFLSKKGTFETVNIPDAASLGAVTKSEVSSALASISENATYSNINAIATQLNALIAALKTLGAAS